MSVVYEANTDAAGAIDLEWRKAMEQLRQEEEAQMQAGTYGMCCMNRSDTVDGLVVMLGSLMQFLTIINLFLRRRLWLQTD